MRQFKCLLPSLVEFGPGKSKELSRLVAGKAVLLLSDKGVSACGIADKIRSLCTATASEVHSFFEVPAEPTEDQINEVVARVDGHSVAAIVAVGGGSVMDTAKLAAVMINNGARLADMFDGTLPDKRTAKLIMLPTTAGTGAESTPNAIVFRPSQSLKVGIVCDQFMPDQVILDPELTLGLPPAITASTGMDALCHALECYISNKANPLSDVLAVEATRLIFASLRRCYEHGDDLEARGEMLLAAFYAGICIASSGTNAVHALSYPLGGTYRIAHGVSNAILLAPAFACNKDACVDKLAAIAHLTGAATDGLSNEAKADVLIQALRDLTRDLRIPRSLAELGVPASDLESIIDAALQVKRLLNNNPKTLTRDDIRGIYQSIL